MDALIYKVGPKGPETTSAFERNFVGRFPLLKSFASFVAQFPGKVDFSSGHVISVCLGGHTYSPVFDRSSYAATRDLIDKTVGLIHPDGSGEPKRFDCALFKREVAGATPQIES